MLYVRQWTRRFTLLVSLALAVMALIAFGAVPAAAQVAVTELESPPVEAPASFGQSVDIDGNTAVASAPDAAVSAVGVYTRNGSGWQLAATLDQPPVPEDRFVVRDFGRVVAISGDTIVTTGAFVDPVAPGFGGGVSESRPFFAAYVRDGGSWTLQSVTEVAIDERDAGAGANFIDAIDIDGDVVVVGDTSSDGAASSSGIALVYQRSGTTWQQVARLAPADVGSFAQFGGGVAVSEATIAVSNADFSQDNTVYVFEQNAGGQSNWGLVQRLTDPGRSRDFGESLAIDGDTLVVSTELLEAPFSSDGTSAALVYERNGNGAEPWELVQTLATPEPPSNFNTLRTTVAISGDRLIVSTLGSINRRGQPGTVYQFNRTGSGNALWTLVDQFNNSSDNGGFDFGFDIALSGDQAIVGAPQAGGGAGAAFIYTLTGGSEPIATPAPTTPPAPTAVPTAPPAPTVAPTAVPQPTATPDPQPDGGPFVFDVNIEFFNGPREGQRIRGTLEVPEIFVTGPQERDDVIGTFTTRSGRQFPARLLILEPGRTQVDSFEINFNRNRSFEDSRRAFFGRGGVFPNGEVRGTGLFANLNRGEISNATFVLTPIE